MRWRSLFALGVLLCATFSGVLPAGAVEYLTEGVSVAGGNGSGSGSNELNRPYGAVVAGDGSIYVADTKNHRVQMWAPGATEGVTVAGGNGSGSSATQLDNPRSVGLDVDGNLYVADTYNHRVQMWAPGATEGVTVAGGNGYGSGADELKSPSSIDLDSDGNIYVADTYNYRVQMWAPGATEGVTVAGGNGSGSAASQLSRPRGVTVAADGNIYVADTYNDRVQMWAPGATEGVTVAGGNGYGSAPDQLKRTWGLDVDSDGNVLVADTVNHRVQLWAPGASEGVTVAGGNGSGSGADDLNDPRWVDVVDGNMYVVDSDNHRVQLFAPANAGPAITSQATASVPENDTSAIDVDAVDDAAGLTYAISGGDDAELFSIDPATGLVVFVDAPDFEIPADADLDNVYSIEVTVTDAGGLTANQQISITVTDVLEDSAPTIVSAASVEALENQSVAIDVNAIDDADAEGEGLVFALDGGPDATRLEIDQFGVVSFIEVPDFEVPGDSNGNNIYLFQVTVTDSAGLETSQIIRVTVVDVEEGSAPAITSPAAVSAPENQTVAIDVDAEDDADGLVFSLSGGDDGELFGIDAASGLVSFVAAPDFEAPADADADNVYSFQVTVVDTDELTTSQDITVTVTDVAENTAPVVVAGDDLSVQLPNGVTVSGSVSDDGLPEPAALTLAWTKVSGPGSATFADSTAAETDVSFSAAGSYVLRFTADDGELTSSDELTVQVTAIPGGPFSPNVRVSVRSGSLFINGDAGNNRVELCQTASGVFVSTVFGGPTPAVKVNVGVTRDVRFNLVGGDDFVIINPASCGGNTMEIGRDLLMSLGTGDDTVEVSNLVVGDDLSLLGSTGDEQATLSGVTVTDRVTVNTAAGASTMAYSSVDFGKAVLRGGPVADVWSFADSDLGAAPALVTFNGDDEIEAIGTVASGRLTISTSNGADIVVWDDSTGDGGDRGGNYTFNGVFGGQDDTVSIGSSLIAGDRLNGGSGRNDTFNGSGPGTVLAFENVNQPN